jgi:proton-dependent oligopeptide transporter, POT family
MEKGHSFAIVPITGARILERAAYYGFRSLFVLYLVHQLQFDDSKATRTYSIFIGLCAVMPLIGGLFSDLLIGSKKSSWIGCFVQAAGFFLIALPYTPALYGGMALISIGTGFCTPNMLAQISFEYQNRKRLMDSAMLIFYAGINLGAFVGGFIFPFFFPQNYSLAFIIAGLFSFISGLILVLSSNFLPGSPATAHLVLKEEPVSAGKLSHSVISIVCIVFFVTMYWLFDSLGSNFSYELSSKLGADHPSEYFWLNWINPVLTLFISILLILVWNFVRMSAFLKIMTGFLLAAFGWSLTALASTMLGEGLLYTVILATVIQAIAELFISPIALAYLASNASRRFRSTILATIVAVPQLLTSLFLGIFFSAQYDAFSRTLYLFGMAGVFIIVAIIFLVLFFTGRRFSGEEISE